MDFKNINKYIKTYRSKIKELYKGGAKSEGNVRTAMATLLDSLAKDNKLSFVNEYPARVYIEGKKKNIRYDGVIKREGYSFGHWEAKDEKDDLEIAIKEKKAKGYSTRNILLENTKLAVLYQDDKRCMDADISSDKELASIIESFFAYDASFYDKFESAKMGFKEKVPELAKELFTKLEDRKNKDSDFKQKLSSFHDECKNTLNPDISIKEIEEMLVQHITTERIFLSVVGDAGYFKDSGIAKSINDVLDAFYDRSTRNELTKTLDGYYDDISSFAKKLPDFEEKQKFLNEIYQVFFNSFSPKTADTLGIVYTPTEIVDFMLESTNDALKEHFGKSLATKGVHILDPCVGTGNFIVHLLEKINLIDPTKLEHKYNSEIHCNEVMLLPYYVANINIEKTYEALYPGKDIKPFNGICLVDSIDLIDKRQSEFIGGGFGTENAKRAKIQQEKDIFVVIGNPPYNAWQKSENEANKNKQHRAIDDSIRETYSKHSTSTNKNSLYDMYVKFFRFATDRLGDKDGVVCFVSNNNFLDAFAFDGFRKQIAKDFNEIVHINLGGNVRKNPKLSGTKHNVFGIQVGVGITLLVKQSGHANSSIKYYKINELVDKDGKPTLLTREERLEFLKQNGSFKNIALKEIEPNDKGNWFPELLGKGFDSFMQIGHKDTKRSKIEEKIFALHSGGVKTNRDKIVYDFSKKELEKKVKAFIELYNEDLERYKKLSTDEQKAENLDHFVTNDNPALKWDGAAKKYFKREITFSYEEHCVYPSLYRPFIKKYMYFARGINNRVYQNPKIFPKADSHNRVICVSGKAHNKDFGALIVDKLPCLDMIEKTQCFPLYSYDEDGTNKQDNITDWARNRFVDFYGDDKITKEDIFYYIYAVLHIKEYKENYKEDLKIELPRIPLLIPKDKTREKRELFNSAASLGRELAELHIGFEEQEEYALQFGAKKAEKEDRYNISKKNDCSISKMKWNKDKSELVYNEDITLTGFPKEAFLYKIAKRAPVEWVIDQYKDWNDETNPYFVIELLKKLVTLSVKSIAIIDKINAIDATFYIRDDKEKNADKYSIVR